MPCNDDSSSSSATVLIATRINTVKVVRIWMAGRTPAFACCELALTNSGLGRGATPPYSIILRTVECERRHTENSVSLYFP
jgi:hypothetical protein